MVALDSGDLFTMQSQLPESARKGTMARADLFLKAYEKQNVAALGIGDRDLSALGVETLQTLAKKTKVPFVNANLVTADKMEPVFTPHVVVEAAGYKLGIFGILTGGATIEAKDKYTLMAPAKAARKQVDELTKKNVDAIIVLAHLDRRDAEALTREVKGIDIVLGGQSMGATRFLESLENGAFWIDPGQKGKYLNVVTLHMSKKGHQPFVVREAADKLKEELTQLDARIHRYVRMAQQPPRPGTRGANPSRYQGIVSSLVRQREDLAKKAGNLEKVAADAPFLAFEPVAMNKALRDDEEVGGWVKKYQEEFEKKDVSRAHARANAAHKRPSRADAATKKVHRPVPHNAIRTLGPKKAPIKAP